MSAHIPLSFQGSAVNLLSYSDLLELGKPIETKVDAVEAMARHFQRVIRDGHLDGVIPTTDRHKRTDAAIVDAAEVFYTTTLEQMLAPITRGPVNQFYMVPGDGSAQLLPVRTTLRPGQTSLVYDIESPTGQASWVDPEGVRKLGQVGEFSERKKHETGWAGIGWGWGLVESWQATEMGRSLDQSRRMTAQMYLNRFCERALMFGDVGHKIDGIINHPSALQASLATKFASITDPDDALEQLQIMDLFFRRMTQTYGGQITGVIAPLTDYYALTRLRYDGGAGELAWPAFVKLLPWLANIQWIDGIDTASASSGPVWIAWSDDPNELWSEMQPTPMLFGPWQDQMRTSFAYLTHLGGVISRRRERIARFDFAA